MWRVKLMKKSYIYLQRDTLRCVLEPASVIGPYFMKNDANQFFWTLGMSVQHLILQMKHKLHKETFYLSYPKKG